MDSPANLAFFSDKAYLFYRQDNENSSVNSKEKIFIICEEYDEITDFLNKNPKQKSFANTQKLIKQYKAYMWNVKRVAKQHRAAFIDIFADTFKKYYEANEFDKEFFKKFKKKDLLLLITDKKQFGIYIEKLIADEKNKAERRKLFSVRINSSRMSITLLGKKIMEIG